MRDIHLRSTEHTYFQINNGPTKCIFFKKLPTITNIVCVREAPELHKQKQCNVNREKLFLRKKEESIKLMNVVNFAIFFNPT